MPDLKAEEKKKREVNKKEPIISFNYDNTLEETDLAMKTFQRKFGSKRGILSIIAYSLLAVAGIVGIFFNPSAVVIYIAVAFCALGLFYSLTEKKRMRKKVIEALKGMNPEDYSCTLYDDKIEIETIIKPKENEIDLEPSEENEEKAEPQPPIKSIFTFGVDMLDLAENEESLLLILARRQIYCFPKRCLSEEQQTTLRDFLKEKLG